MASFVTSFCLVLLACAVLNVQADDPEIKWIDYSEKDAGFKFYVPTFDKKVFCANMSVAEDPVCDTEARKHLYDLNKDAHGNDYDLKHTFATCIEVTKPNIASVLPPDVKKGCQINVKSHHFMKYKTDIEFQIWNDEKSKVAKARFSKPYDD